MPKKLIQKYMPDPETLKNHKHLSMFGSLLHNPNLWHLNRRSAAGAFAVGLLCAWIPVPFQMFIAAGLAILFHVHLPISVALVWLTNPLTMPIMFYGAYKFGSVLLGLPEQEFAFEASMEWLSASLHTIMPPFLLGCAVIGIICACLSYVLINTLWRLNVRRKWNKRHHKPSA